MGCLYRIDFPNGKAYIGMTVSDPRKRFSEHRYQAALTIMRRHVSLGRYFTIAEAASARRDGGRKYFGTEAQI